MNPAINIHCTGLVFLLVDGLQRRELGFEGRILLPLSDPVQASNQLCSQLGLAGADKEKTMTRNNAWKSKIRKFSYGGLLLATLLLTGVTPRMTEKWRPSTRRQWAPAHSWVKW